MKDCHNGVGFFWDEESGKCCVMTGIRKLANGEKVYDECITEDNPIIAKNIYINRIDGILSREIADKLEAAGRNRYTGELQQ